MVRGSTIFRQILVINKNKMNGYLSDEAVRIFFSLSPISEGVHG